MPVAAIESLVLLLSSLPPTLSTISETLDLLATSTQRLKRSVANPISLSAGTDLFSRYLITTLQRGSNASGNDFKAIRQHLISNGRLFVKRAKEARQTIAGYARRFVRDGSVVLTNGGSRVVGAVLQAAAEAQTAENGSPRFKVIYVQSSPLSPSASESHTIIRALRRLSVPVATIPESAVAYSMGKVTMVMVGAEGVVENGGVISRMGTYQMGILAREKGKPCYVVAESHKFVRMFPLGQYDLPIEQRVLDFRTDDDGMEVGKRRGEDGAKGLGIESAESPVDEKRWDGKTPRVVDRKEYFDKPDPVRTALTQDSAVDYTPPEYITALITESGVHTPSAVSEELIKIWY